MDQMILLVSSNCNTVGIRRRQAYCPRGQNVHKAASAPTLCEELTSCDNNGDHR